MKKWIAVFLTGMFSLQALDIPRDEGLLAFSLKGIEVWLKQHLSAPSEVACRFISCDPQQSKPQILDLDCPSQVFETELPRFLKYCEEEVRKQGGWPIGLVAVGAMDLEGLKSYLMKEWQEENFKSGMLEEKIRLFPMTGRENMDVRLSYLSRLSTIHTDQDLKKLWVFYLIQRMAEERFKQAAEMDESWISPAGSRYLLPALETVGHGIERADGSQVSSKLLVRFLQVIQTLKEYGFTEEELTDCKARLQGHLKSFYQPLPDASTLADYYASHLAAGLPCLDYSMFMMQSWPMIADMSMSDISEALKTAFLDETRKVSIAFPEKILLTKNAVQETLDTHSSDQLIFEYREEEKKELDENDPFAQLLITEEEQQLMRETVQTVAKTNPLKLGFMRGELEERRQRLLHIHPLRSMAVFMTDSYTKKCVAEILDSFFKGSSFVKDLSERMKQESEKENLIKYVPGFCQAVKANADQVRFYIQHQEYEKLIKYLLKVNK